MAHMSEKEWGAFAASKDLDAATGGKRQAPTESGMNEYDFQQIMGAIRSARQATERLQMFTGIGFAALAILIAWLR